MPETYTKEQIDKAVTTLKKCVTIEGQYETGPYRCKQATLGGYVYVSKGVFTVSLTTERDIIISALSTAEQERDTLKAQVAELEARLQGAADRAKDAYKKVFAEDMEGNREYVIDAIRAAIAGKKEG